MKGTPTMYEKPEVLATYTEAELRDEAAVCVAYGPCTTEECGN